MPSTQKLEIQVSASLVNAEQITQKLKDSIEKGLILNDRSFDLKSLTSKIQQARNLMGAGAVPEAAKLAKEAGQSLIKILSLVNVEAGGVSNNIQSIIQQINQANDRLDKLKDSALEVRGHYRQDKEGNYHYSKQYAQKLLGEDEAQFLQQRTKKSAYTAREVAEYFANNNDPRLAQLGFHKDSNNKLVEDTKTIEAKRNAESAKLNTEIDKTVAALQRFQAQLHGEVKNADTPIITNDTGDRVGFKEDLKNTVNDYENLNKTVQDYNNAKRQEVKNNQDSANSLENGRRVQDRYNGSLSKAVSTFFGYQMILRQLRRLWRTAISTVQDLDKQLTNQAIVTGMAREEVWKLATTYQDLAAATGLAQTTIASVATEYLRQGESLSDALTLTKAAAAAATVAGISAEDSVKYLTTAVHGFKLEAEDALSVSDKFASLAAQAATNYEDLAIALSKVASQASLAGMSMDYTLALLTTGLDVTQEAPESIGTALKTIIARMREISDYGKTLEDNTDLNQVEDGLAAVGIKLRDASGELRSTEKVLDELGRKWGNLTANQQAAVAKALAGTRQQSRLVAIMENYDDVIKYQEQAANSIGATTAQQMTYLTGLEAATNRLKNAYQSLITKVAQSDSMIWLMNVLTKLLDQLASFFSTKGGFITFFGLLLTTMMKSQTFLQRMVGSWQAIWNAARGTTAEMRNQAALANGSNGTSSSGGTAATPTKLQRFSQAAGGIAAAITLATMTVGWVQEIIQQEKEGYKQIVADNITAGNEIQAQIYNNNKTKTTIDNLRISLEDFDKQIIKSTEDLADEQETRTQLIEALGLDANIGANMSNSVLRDRALAESTRLEKKNDKLISDLGETLMGAADKDWGAGAMSIVTKGLSGMGIGALAGGGIGAFTANPIIAGIGAGVGALIGGAAGIITGVIKEVKDARQREDTQKKIHEMLQTDEGVSQFQTLLNYNYKGNAGLSQQAEANVRSTYGSLISMLNGDQIEALLKQYDYNYETISQALSNSLANVTDAVDTLNDEEAKYVEKTEAIKTVYAQLSQIAPELADAFYSIYGNYIELDTILGTSLSLLDDYQWNLSLVNNLINALGKENARAGIEALAAALEESKTNTEALAEATKGWSHEARVAAEELITNGQSMQDIADKQTLYDNKVSNFRETQAKWNEMSESEKRAFINDNTGFFNIEGAAEAFYSGQDITPYLTQYRENLQEELRKDIQDQMSAAQLRLAEAKEQLDAATTEEERKAASDAIQNAERELRELGDQYERVNSMFDLTISEVVNKQNQQIEKLKEMYKAEEEALTESLEKRREAYEKYFDALENTERIEEYAANRDELIASLSKISAGTDANSRNKVRELQKQLKKLEETEAKSRAEQARQAVLDNIDSQIENIEKQFDELLDNNVKLLESMDANTKIQYLEYLRSTGKTPEELKLIEQELADLFNGTWGTNGLNAYGAAVTTAPTTTTVDSTQQTYVTTLNINGKQEKVELTGAQMQSFMKSMFSELERLTGKKYSVAQG